MARSRMIWASRMLVFVLFVFTFTFYRCGGEEARISEGLRRDAEVLRAIKRQISADPTAALRRWGEQPDPCGWYGVVCDRVVTGQQEVDDLIGTRVVGLDFWGLELEGTVSEEIGQLTELRRIVIVGNKISGRIPLQISNCRKLVSVDLRANKLSGHIPFSLAHFPYLESLKLSENQFTGTLESLFFEQKSFELCPRLEVFDVAKNWLRGTIPADIGKCNRLREVSVNDNGLVGEIPLTFGSLQRLASLQLNSNFLAGHLPASIANCQNLDLLDVSENLLTGHIPEKFAQFVGEKRFNFSSNDFHGPIPQGKWKVHQMARAGAFTNNPDLCGRPLKKVCKIAATKDELNDNLNHEGLQQLTGDSSSRMSETSRRTSRRSLADGDAPSAAPSASPPAQSPQPPKKKKNDHTVRRWALGLALGIVVGALAAGLLAIILRLCVFFLHKSPPLQGPIIFEKEIKPKMLAFLEKEDALSESNVVGKGGAGKVYRVQLDTGNGIQEVAVKAVILNEDATESKSESGKKQIQAELETLGCIRHRNLTRLLAYVHRPDSHLLVYKYMENGSLDDALRKAASGDLVMPWPLRHRIAVDTAVGLAYLHEECHPKIIHRDLKPSNILLDKDFVAHVSDFGLAKAIPGYDTHITTANVAGTRGYIAPEYHQVLQYTVKSDVFSFGVVLAVLLTGREPTDIFFHTAGGSIGGWLCKLLKDGKLEEAIDPRLRNAEFDEEIKLGLRIAVFCSNDNPADRPTSKEALEMLTQIRLVDGTTPPLSEPSSSDAPPAAV